MSDNSASVDPVTGLPGRAAFETALSHIGANRPGNRVAVLLIGLDGFTVVRDGLGFDAADELLAGVARVLEKVLAERRHVLALLSGDVFALALPGEYDRTSLVELAESVITTLSRPSYVAGVGVGISVSIGIALAGDGTELPLGPMRSAQVALRRAKELGRTRWALFDAVTGAADAERYRLACGIAGAVESGDMAVVYRPHVVLPDGEIITSLNGALRWRHPELGELAPEEFYPLAELTGMTITLGRHLLSEALRTAGEWRARFGDEAPTVCLTLPPRMAVDGDLVSLVGSELDRNGLRHRDIMLCANAPSLVDDRGDLLGSLAELAGAGVVFVVTITGLAELELLPTLDVPAPGVMLTGAIIDALEIDSPPEQAVRAVRQVVERAGELGITVGALGVPSQAHANLLFDNGVVVGSGPFLPTYATGAEAAVWAGRTFPRE